MDKNFTMYYFIYLFFFAS